MYIEMELLARERYETRLREAAATHHSRSLVGSEHRTARAVVKRPIPRLRQG
jgi:hypothetical protein